MVIEDHHPVSPIDRGAPTTRGSKFALAFMSHYNGDSTQSSHTIALFITTEQESSAFTIQTKFAGVAGKGFAETSPGSGLYSRSEVARRGSFTLISLPAGVGKDPDISVQANGTTDIDDRQKGVIIETDDPTHELTVYVFNSGQSSTDAYMAINCVKYPAARNYQYFVFSSATVDGVSFESRFLITPCEDDTSVSIQPSQPLAHPDWVKPRVTSTQAGQDQINYGRKFGLYNTLMISHHKDLTGSIVTSDKPLSVFVGHQCGAPAEVGSCEYLVEQVPPHPTYSDIFFMAPFAVRESGEIYRIGSVSDRAHVTINCDCMADSGSGNRVALQSSGVGVYTATVNRGEYVQCRTPEDAQSYCCIQSSHPVTVMGYTLGNQVDNLTNVPNLPFGPIGGPSMLYIPPATSYLKSYSLITPNSPTTPFQGYLSYILPAQVFDNSPENQSNLILNGVSKISPDECKPISCQVGSNNEVCAYGATRLLGQGSYEIEYESIGTEAFWGFAYGYAQERSFAYPLPFGMEPVGCKFAWPRL